MSPARDNSERPVAVLGAGSWGTALSILLTRNGRPALLWGHHSDQIEQLAANRENTRYLPGRRLPDSLQLSSDLRETVAAARDLLVVVPSHAFRDVVEHLAPLVGADHRIAWATKGLEPGTCKLLHEVAAECLGEDRALAVISGPTFAKEVAAGLPTAVTVASRSTDFANDLAARLHDEAFRAYTNEDIIGVELGGAIKNVLAIAAGISDGLGFGANARAALITRGLTEIVRLGVALGGRRETFMGLAGLGDLVLTCTDDQSRNRRMGLGLAAGKQPDQICAEIGQVVEGIKTAREVHDVSGRVGVEMPIASEVFRVLHEGHDAHAAVHELLGRTQKAETF